MELGENRLPEGVCYFCGKRPARPESVFKQLMMEKVQVIEHKSVVNTPGGMDVRANKLKQTSLLTFPVALNARRSMNRLASPTNLPAMLMAFGGSCHLLWVLLGTWRNLVGHWLLVRLRHHCR